MIRACREVGIFTEDQTIIALTMVNDRNLIVYTYNEELAIKIYDGLKKYNLILSHWIEAIKNRQKAHQD